MIRKIIFLGLLSSSLAGMSNLGYSRLRFPNVKTDDSIVYLTGLLVPIPGASDDGVPTYEFRSTINGAPVAETDHYFYRCSFIEDHQVAYAKGQQQPLLCYNVDVEKGVATAEEVSDKADFILSADQLHLPKEIKEINLLFGKSTYRNFQKSAVPVEEERNLPIRPYDGYAVVSSDGPLLSFLEYSPLMIDIRASEEHLLQVPNIPPPLRFL